MKRPLFVTVLLVTILSIMGLGYFFWNSKNNVTPTGISVEPILGTATDESVSLVSDGTQGMDAGSDQVVIETLIAEIEKTAMGDENALDEDSAAENENIQRGAVVVEELGLSYDENEL